MYVCIWSLRYESNFLWMCVYTLSSWFWQNLARDPWTDMDICMWILNMRHMIWELMWKCVYSHWLLCKRVYIHWIRDIDKSLWSVNEYGYVCIWVYEYYDMRVKCWNVCICIEFVISRRPRTWSIDRYGHVQCDARQRWVSVSEQFGGVHSLHVCILNMRHMIRDLMCKCVYIHWHLCKREYIHSVRDIDSTSLVIYNNGCVCMCVCESHDMRVQCRNACECIEFVVSTRRGSWTVGRYGYVCIYVLVWDVQYHIVRLILTITHCTHRTSHYTLYLSYRHIVRLILTFTHCTHRTSYYTLYLSYRTSHYTLYTS